MLQIGEFSRICQVSVKTLHYYDKIGLLVPAEVDRLTGYRYYHTDSSDIELFIGIREKEKADNVMEPCECAMTVHRGGYSTLSEAYGAVVSWISENGYEITGEPFDIYIKTQFDSLSPEDWETEVYFPVRKDKPTGELGSVLKS